MVSNAWRYSGSSAEASRGIPIIEIPEARPAAKIACPQAPSQSSRFERYATRAMDGTACRRISSCFPCISIPASRAMPVRLLSGWAMLRTNPAATDGIVATCGCLFYELRYQLIVGTDRDHVDL